MQNKYTFFESPNFNARSSSSKIDFIILHYTVIDFPQTKRVFLERSRKVSSHYVVNTDGAISQFVKESDRAWHAGVSYFSGQTDINSASIGIEIINPGYVAGKPITPYSDIQINSVINLCKEIAQRYSIKKYNILGHSDIAVERKIDPGYYFPWQKLSENGVGIYPSAEDINKQNIDNFDTTKALQDYGYAIKNINLTKKAFQAHFSPNNWIKNISFGVVEAKALQFLLNYKNCN